jgi:hypothetical protein
MENIVSICIVVTTLVVVVVGGFWLDKNTDLLHQKHSVTIEAH